MEKLQEATTSINIPSSETNLTADEMFQQSGIESLAMRICAVTPLQSPIGGVFNIKRKAGTNDLELVRKNVEVLPTELIKTGLSQEALQNIMNIFGKKSTQIIGNLFRGIANEIENTALLSLLRDKSKDYGELALSDSLNFETNLGELMQRVNEIIIKMNQKNFRTYEAFAILPAIALTSIYSVGKLFNHHEEFNENGLFLTKIASTNFYLNPDVNDNYAYVGLNDFEDLGKSSLYFAPYQSQIIETNEYDTGNLVYFLINRFAISESPLHEVDDEMLYKFEIKN